MTDSGALIRFWREQRELSQAKLAVKAQSDPRYISALELGRYVPTVATLRRLADALDVSIVELLPAAMRDAAPAEETLATASRKAS